MATTNGRTVSKYVRAYVDGYDMSGYTVSVGALNHSFDANEIITLTDAVKGAYPGRANISIGNINGVHDNTATSGFHTRFGNASDAVRDVMIPIGIRSAPTTGHPVFCAQVNQMSYQAEPVDGMVTATLGLGNWDARADTNFYPYPWGWMLHAKGAETATSGNVGTAGYDYGDTGSLHGGYMMYQIFTGSAGSVTLKVQDSTGGGAWADVPGLTSGAIANASLPTSKVVKTTALTTQVDKQVRWQMALGTASTVTFALAFVRGGRNT